jgi:hypothetical protein
MTRFGILREKANMVYNMYIPIDTSYAEHLRRVFSRTLFMSFEILCFLYYYSKKFERKG